MHRVKENAHRLPKRKTSAPQGQRILWMNRRWAQLFYMRLCGGFGCCGPPCGPQCAFAACLFRLRLNTAGLPRYVLPAFGRCEHTRGIGRGYVHPALPSGGRCEHTPRFFGISAHRRRRLFSCIGVKRPKKKRILISRGACECILRIGVVGSDSEVLPRAERYRARHNLSANARLRATAAAILRAPGGKARKFHPEKKAD